MGWLSSQTTSPAVWFRKKGAARSRLLTRRRDWVREFTDLGPKFFSKIFFENIKTNDLDGKIKTKVFDEKIKSNIFDENVKTNNINEKIEIKVFDEKIKSDVFNEKIKTKVLVCNQETFETRF